MESIKIENIDKKPKNEEGHQLVIVKYNGDKEATLNTKWQSQQVDYIEKDVGIGGQVIVEIVKKGDYTNITKVDFNSAVKGEAEPKEALPQKPTQEKFRTPNEMVATELTVAVIGAGGRLPIDEVVGMYKEILRLLNE